MDNDFQQVINFFYKKKGRKAKNIPTFLGEYTFFDFILARLFSIGNIIIYKKYLSVKFSITKISRYNQVGSAIKIELQKKRD
jgi:phenylalanine-4-hydroxylase